MFKGIRLEEIEKLSREFVMEKIVPALKPQALANLQNYRAQGYKIILASASFEIYVKPMAEYLNCDYYFGTLIETKEGKLHNRILGANCKGRAKIERIVEVIDPQTIDREASVSYSDSLSDLPFLDLTATFYLTALKSWKIKKVFHEGK